MKIGSVKIKVWTHRKKIRKHSLNLGITPGSERTSQNLSLWNDTLESSAETRRLTLHIEDISTWR